MNKLIPVFFLLNMLAFICAQGAISQQPSGIDSLLIALKSDKTDTVKIKNLNLLSKEYMNTGNYDKALEYAIDALELSKKINFRKGTGSSYNQIGEIYRFKDDYPNALKKYFACLKIMEDIGDKKGIADSYNNIGLIHDNLGNYPEALKNYYASLKIRQEMGDKKGIASSYGNIGISYAQQAEAANPDSAKSKFKESLKNLFLSLKIMEEIGDKQGMANCYNNIGIIYHIQGNYPEVLKNFSAALSIRKEIGDKEGMATSYINIGSINTIHKNFSEAKRYLENGLSIAKEIGSKSNIQSGYRGLSALDTAIGNWKSAYLNYKLYSATKDSIFNEESSGQMAEMQTKYETEKKEKEIMLQKAELGKKEVLIKQQTTQKLAFAAGFALMLALAGVSYRNYRNKRKAHIIIAHQKALVEEKNKDITDSINYAKRLQQAILPSEKSVKANFKDSFILYKPKDIVAGDFYWMETPPSPLYKGSVADSNGVVLFAAADCTGHGVPGAMVSVVCSNALNRAVKEFGLTDPGKILDKVTDLVIETFEKSESDVYDGMDISLFVMESPSLKKSFPPSFSVSEHAQKADETEQEVRLTWAGANNPLWIIRSVIASEAKQSLTNEQIASLPPGVRNDGFQLTEIKPDKQPIGKYDNRKPFTTHSITLFKGDTLYLFTDGYADQFGGEKGKKFKYNKLKELLLSIQEWPMSEQKRLLDEAFETWRGNLEQVDDVCIIGVRL